MMQFLRRLLLGKGTIYPIRRSLWYMPAISYETDEKLIDIYKLMAECNAPEEGNEPDLQTILRRFYQSGIVPRLFALILRPYQPTFFHRIWNDFWCWKNKVDPANLQAGMSREEWGTIVTDFFVISGIGILPSNDFAQALGLTGSSRESKSSGRSSGKPTANPILPILFFMGSLSSMLQMRASETGRPSEAPTP